MIRLSGIFAFCAGWVQLSRKRVVFGVLGAIWEQFGRSFFLLYDKINERDINIFSFLL